MLSNPLKLSFAGPIVEARGKSYTGGDKICGELLIHTTEPVLTRSITILIHGYENISLNVTKHSYILNT